MQRLLLDMRHTSMGFESMQKYFLLHRLNPQSVCGSFRRSSLVDFLLSLNWRLEIRLGISFLLSANFSEKVVFHCRYLMSPLLNSRLSSISENLGTTPLRLLFPSVFTKSYENCLQISVFFWILHESCAYVDLILKVSSPLLYYKSCMCSFLLPFFYLLIH